MNVGLVILDRSEEMLFNLKDDSEFKKNPACEKSEVWGKMQKLALEDVGNSIPDYVFNWPKYEVSRGEAWEETR